MSMNRSERRKLAKQGVKVPAEPTVNLRRSDLVHIRKEATLEGTKKAFTLMLAIPVMIMHDKFGQLMKKEGREERFAEMCLELFDTYEKGYVSLEDLHQCLYEETGIKVEII